MFKPIGQFAHRFASHSVPAIICVPADPAVCGLRPCKSELQRRDAMARQSHRKPMRSQFAATPNGASTRTCYARLHMAPDTPPDTPLAARHAA
ncbi:hypothetical protein [Chitinasiproducens palmae]|uniref:hypothetical protein n=1 Tax=Chitinasiproducens palmae TaxID=1770053 RepID=UPI001113B1A3|nr:hypothetical protein [Chitinasiproducens palmae]